MSADGEHTEPNRRFVFLGKAAIYSAGVTFMSFFARHNRYLTRGTRLMIHERKLSKKLVIDGPLTTCVAVVMRMISGRPASAASASSWQNTRLLSLICAGY
jgi:hypothetical protein